MRATSVWYVRQSANTQITNICSEVYQLFGVLDIVQTPKTPILAMRSFMFCQCWTNSKRPKLQDSQWGLPFCGMLDGVQTPKTSIWAMKSFICFSMLWNVAGRYASFRAKWYAVALMAFKILENLVWLELCFCDCLLRSRWGPSSYQNYAWWGPCYYQCLQNCVWHIFCCQYRSQWGLSRYQ